MRERLFLLLLILGFGILVIRLFVLQVVQGAYWREIAEGNRIKITKIPALRGIVYDRNDKQLIRNTPEGREYVFGPALAHVLGYIGEISEEELKDFDTTKNTYGVSLPEYAQGDLIGKIGIERQYDKELRGRDGGMLVEVDAGGRPIRQLGESKPISGNSLKLSIDINLQEKIYELLKEKKGAVVATDTQTGEILALVSSPSFDPNVFSVKCQMSNVKCSDKISKILSDNDQPMFDRAIAGQYPPGSTFKIVTAIAGLQEGKINPETTVEDKGILKVGKWSFSNWYFTQYGRTEGLVDIVKAIKRSNDIFFYKVGEWLGIDNLSIWARTFGLGRTSGIDIPGEETGLVPDKQWKKDYKGEDWYLGDDYITAIGQGDLLTTPLQINLMTGVIANGGKWCKPEITQKSKVKSQNCKELEIKKENIELVKEGMKEACDTGGTGWPFFKFKVSNENLDIDEENFFGPTASDSANVRYVPVGCKTGTSETTGDKSKPHAWFTVFAPLKDPQIVLTVLLENAGEGSAEAAPVAKEILKWWLESKN